MRGTWACSVAVIASLSSCDCFRRINAVVLEEGTAHPVGDVEVRERNANGSYEEQRLLTTANGTFEFSDVSGGFRCPDVQLHFAKPGYLPLDRTFPSTTSGDTICLKRLP